MNSRILSTVLELNEQPQQNIKFLDSCDNLSHFYENRFVSLRVSLKNFDIPLPNRTLFLAISLVNECDQLTQYPSPNFLFCTNKNMRFVNKLINDDSDFFYVPLEAESMSCEIKNFQIVKKSAKKLSELAESYTIACLQQDHQTIDLETFSNQSKNLLEILLSQQKKCRIKLQVKIFNKLEKKFENYLTEPIYSDVISDCYDMCRGHQSADFNPMELINTDITNLDNIRIVRTSRVQGSMNGGDEMFLFTTYFDPNDLLVEFFQLNKNGDIGWKSYAKFNKLDSHVNFALVIQTPRFDLNEVESENSHKIRVYFRLHRPSRNDYSEKWVFYYLKKNNDDLKTTLVGRLAEEKLKLLSLNSNGIKRKIEEKCDPEIQKDMNLIKKNKVVRSDKDTLDSGSNDSNERDGSNGTEGSNTMDTSGPVSSLSPDSNSDKKVSLDGVEKKDPIQSQIKLDTCYSKMNNLADRTGQSLLKFAKNRSLHDLLKTQRFLMNFADEDGNCPLHLSIQHKNFDLLEIFVDVIMTIPHQNIINLRNKAGFTPLLMAAHLEELDLCEFLLEANADLAMADLDGNNPVHLACKRNNIRLLKVLIKYVDRQHNYGVLNAVNLEGYAPIHLCTLNGSFEMVRELLYFKTLRVNMPDKKVGYSALHYASISSSSYKIAELLVKNEKVDVNCKSHTGCTPLHLAVANRNYLATILLMSNAADPNIQNDVPVHIDYGSMQYLLIRDLKVVEEHLKKQPLLGNEANEEKVLASQQLTKISEEVKKIFEQHLNSCVELVARSKNFNHNHDPLAYAESDSWMREIFNSPRNMSKQLLLRIGSYEKIKREMLQKKISIQDLNESKVKLCSDAIKSFNENKIYGDEKLSQQESCHFLEIKNNQMIF
ncbi:nuclear factor NF-kappa-B p100 subunit-like protein [Brachionus plicatilis]|uniref:Nuclear factor NF-kappa-B p100 subunit-like protein n=1 Tax=Brachionus plicatilis TaxID=10195 RepID=A0A3M7PNV9_BRAPC|nr:nuclear factor NF-kappa-B p100 subunit-like protein [Brachionus plicatilis]